MTALITSRTRDYGKITIDHKKCNACGICVEICPGKPLYMENDMVKVNQENLYGCIGCGHCTAACPLDCIVVEGRSLAKEDYKNFASTPNQASSESLKQLMYKRRSIRFFKDKAVDKKLLQDTIEMASMAPMGLPPSDVQLLVFDCVEKVQSFAADMVNHFKKIKWIFSPVPLWFLSLFIGKEDKEMMKVFIRPLMDFITNKREQGEDWLLYNAPSAIYFHATPYTDPADPYIAATYAMLAAESMGLGTCMIGSIAPFIKSGAGKLRKKYGIPPNNKHGLMLLIGYPKFKYRKGIDRSFAEVRYF